MAGATLRGGLGFLYQIFDSSGWEKQVVFSHPGPATLPQRVSISFPRGASHPWWWFSA
jgi:hypothetical protein